jgi:[protein-PII] uridylyltransferase
MSESQYLVEKKALLESLSATSIQANLGQMCRLAEVHLKRLWDAAELETEASLLAVGGFGRGDLFPFSDVDLLILLPKLDHSLDGKLERFIGLCWDAGLEIGHSVRTVEECVREAQADFSIQTALLERRFLYGQRGLAFKLAKALKSLIDPKTFYSAKLLELHQRHAKFEDTPYSLEPNIKESPGGLRDLQILLWISRASGLGDTWQGMIKSDLMTREELGELKRADRILKTYRWVLHKVAGRREDRLVFDLQAQVGKQLGFDSSPAVVKSERRVSEEVMQRYYIEAKHITQLNTIILQNLETRLFPQPDAKPEPINSEFRNRDSLLELIDPQQFQIEPSAILRAFLVMQQHPELKGMTTPTIRAMWRARHQINAAFRRAPENRALFLKFLMQPRGITRELRRMNKWSILSRYLPVFGRIVGRMQHDLFHVYTVDQHILMVVRNFRRFFIAEHAHEYPFCSQLAADLEKPWLVTIAALFHDIAKGRGGDHSKLGMVDTEIFCRHHGLMKVDTAFVSFLVEHHLTMSSVAQKQDLSDPEVIESFAKLVGDPERLKALYLLTVADIRGTSPKVWNAWKAKLIEDLFRQTARFLSGEKANYDVMADSKRDEARRLLNLYALAPESYEAFWSSLDLPYFLRTDPADIAWHTRVLFRHLKSEQAIVKSRLSPVGEGFQILVYVPDQADLFARICGYFDSKNLSVLDARIHTTSHGYALDSFLVVDPNGDKSDQSVHYRDILNLVETELTQRLIKHGPLQAPIKGRLSRRSRYFPIKPSVALRADERGRHYLLSVNAADRTGLLYSIATVLSKHGVNLQTARVTTLGERVEDVFVIDGAPLANLKQQLQLETDLLEALAA